MGPSGSGKTTMLSLLTDKYDKQLRVTGEVSNLFIEGVSKQ
jgi:ABC-type uncharacterized transport system YnjBCD ATPase subunit